MPEKNNQVTAEQKAWAAVSYLFILSIVALAARKKDDFIRGHANQGLFLLVLSLIFALVPLIGWLLNFLVFLAMLVGIIKSLQGQKWVLPIAGDWPKKMGDWLIETIKL